MQTFHFGELTFTSDDFGASFEVKTGNAVFRSNDHACYIDENAKEIAFSDLKCSCEPLADGRTGMRYDYNDFTVCIFAESETALGFSFAPKSGLIRAKAVCWPAPITRTLSKNGYAVLPVMQGMLLPDTEKDTHNLMNGRLVTREGTLPFFGEADDGKGYMTLVDTPYDAEYRYNHVQNRETVIGIRWIPSMDEMRGERKLRIFFYETGADYVAFAKRFRQELIAAGEFVTLKEKIKAAPVLAGMVGAPIFNGPVVYYKIEEDSSYYHKEEPEKNLSVTPFSEVAKGIDHLREMGIEHAYYHLDGWGFGGYDNLCPRVLPPAPPAGGAAGLKEVMDACKRNGYLLAYHDQYRDYYFKSPDYDKNNVALLAGGVVGSREEIVWYGGAEAQLCAAKAIDYLRRNYEGLQEMGLLPDGAYLDVFSASELDECFNPEHPMTREDCVKYRSDCFDYICGKNMIISSEEIMWCFVKKLHLVHHSPYINAFFPFLEREPFGVEVPLLNLVFHECIFIPWYIGVGAWGLPENESGFLHCLLCGNSASVPFAITEPFVKKSRTVSKLNRQVAFSEMTDHGFIDGNLKHQYSCFSDGTRVEVDLIENTYRIVFPDGSTEQGKDE